MYEEVPLCPVALLEMNAPECVVMPLPTLKILCVCSGVGPRLRSMSTIRSSVYILLYVCAVPRAAIVAVPSLPFSHSVKQSRFHNVANLEWKFVARVGYTDM